MLILKHQTPRLFQCQLVSQGINHSQATFEIYPSKVLFFLFNIYLIFKFRTENYSAILDNQYVIQWKYKARGNTCCNWIKYRKDTTSILKIFLFFLATRSSSLQYWSATDFRTLNKEFELVVLLQKIREPWLQWAPTTIQISFFYARDQHFCGRKTLSGVCILDTIWSEIKISFSLGECNKRIEIKQHFIQLEMQ